jgi:hypothetical protein
MKYLLDVKLDKLKENGASSPTDCSEISGGRYPIGWCELLGRIFHHVCYKYKEKLLNTLPQPVFYDYK